MSRTFGTRWCAVVALAVMFLMLNHAAFAATTRVNTMPDRQVRPGVAIPVFGNSFGSLAIDPCSWSFSANPNVTVAGATGCTVFGGDNKYIANNFTFTLNSGTREIITATLTVGGQSDSTEIDIVAAADPISDTPLENLSVNVNIAIQGGLRAMYRA